MEFQLSLQTRTDCTYSFKKFLSRCKISLTICFWLKKCQEVLILAAILPFRLSKDAKLLRDFMESSKTNFYKKNLKSSNFLKTGQGMKAAFYRIEEWDEKMNKLNFYWIFCFFKRRYLQCDQIGLFLKCLVCNFSYKISLIHWATFGDFLKSCTFKVKTAVATYYVPLWKKFGYFLI